MIVTIVTTLQTLRVRITVFILCMDLEGGMEGCSKRGGCGDYFNSNCFFSATYCSSMGRFSLMVFECNVVLFVFSCWD
jgi:hypothetical protein